MKNEAFNILFSQIKEGTVGIEAKMFYKGCFISSDPCFSSKREQLWTTFAGRHLPVFQQNARAEQVTDYVVRQLF